MTAYQRIERIYLHIKIAALKAGIFIKPRVKPRAVKLALCAAAGLAVGFLLTR